MNCERIDQRLLGMTGADPQPAFDAGERDHIRECPRCREREAEAVDAFARIARSASADAPPGPEYWGSVVPRLRRRLDSEPRWIPRSWDAAIRTALMPAAAAVVLAIVIVVAAVRTPDGVGTASLASLSDAELHELRLAGTNNGLLEAAETNGDAEWTIADFIADLVSEDGDTALYAVVEPEELLPHVDDAEFAEIVSLLENK
jgi:hypothetical protein